MIPKGYKHTELGVLPKDWEVVRLGDVGKIVGGGTPDTENSEYWTQQDGIVWLTPTEIKTKYITESQRQITKKGLEESSAKSLPKHTILITTRATIGDVGIAKVECTTNQGFQSLICSDSLNYEYAYYALQAHQTKKHFMRFACGSTFLELGSKEVRKTKIPLPPLAEQGKIAEILSTWDTQIQNFETLITEKQTLKKGLCQTLLTAKTRLKGFGGDWEVVRLGDVCEIRNGFAFQSKKFKKSGFPIVRISNIKSNNSISLKNMVYFSSDDYKNKDLKNFIVHQNDVLVALSGATTGKIGKMKEDVILYLNQRVGRFQPSERLNNDFLYQCLLLQSNILFLLSGGGAQPNLSTTTIKNKIFIPLPPLAEQEKIAEILSEADNEITLLEQKLESLKSQKRGLMQNLLNGKVRVKS